MFQNPRIKGIAIFTLVGLSFIVVGIVFYVLSTPELEKRCTERVAARIVGFEEYRDPTTREYENSTPVFSYEYGGEYYTSSYRVYSDSAIHRNKMHLNDVSLMTQRRYMSGRSHRKVHGV